MELMPLSLRGDKGEVRPFTAVKAGTSPDFSLNIKLVGLTKGAWTAAGMVQRQTQDVESCQNDCFRRVRRKG